MCCEEEFLYSKICLAQQFAKDARTAFMKNTCIVCARGDRGWGGRCMFNVAIVYENPSLAVTCSRKGVVNSCDGGVFNLH